jgi:outer membrane protein TolC
MKRFFYYSLLLMLAAPAAALAQGKPLTLGEAIKLGLENSSALKADDARLASAEARYGITRSLALPSVKAIAGYTKLSDIDPFMIQVSPNSEPVTLFPVITNNYMTRLSVNQNVFTGFRLKYGLQSSMYVMEALKLDKEKDKADVVINIVNAYYNLYKAMRSQRVIHESLLQSGERVKMLQSMENAGTATHNDVLRTELLQSNIELTEADVNSNVEIASFNFKLMLGLPDSASVTIDTSLAAGSHNTQQLKDYMSAALNGRPELKAIDLREKAAETNVDLVKGNYYPQVSVGANYYYSNPNPRYIPPREEFKGTWDLGINLVWDISSLYTNKKQIAEQKANVEVISAQEVAISDAVKMEVNQAYLSYTNSLEKVQVAHKAAAQADENYRVTLSRFNNNIALLTDLLDADVLQLQAHMSEASTQADAEVAYHKLLKAIGTINQ